MIRVVSLFCGAGFSDAALYRASAESGVPAQVVAAYDSWPKAVKVYNANLHPVAEVRDVKQMTRGDLPPHDLVIGGPPCQDHSLAGKRACQCNVGGPVSPRCCLADFVRLRGPHWLMENVRSRLVPDPFSVKLNASYFGDVTTRERWFYSSELLHVIEAPGPRRIRDIREAGADEHAIRQRLKKTAQRAGESLHKNGAHEHYVDDEMLGSLTAHARHGHDIRNGKLIPISARHYRPGDLKIGMRGHSASASAFEDDAFLGSFVSNSWHGNEFSRLEGCRNPTLLEMARAHSIPDTWDWAGVTKTDRGQMIANGWPIGMGTAVLKGALLAVAGERAA